MRHKTSGKWWAAFEFLVLCVVVLGAFVDPKRGRRRGRGCGGWSRGSVGWSQSSRYGRWDM